MVERPNTFVARQTEECIERITDRWIYFTDTLKFKADVRLSAIIDGFSMPTNEFIKLNYPLLHAAPAGLFWMMIFRAVQVSNTHPQAELDEAIKELYEKYRLDR